MQPQNGLCHPPTERWVKRTRKSYHKYSRHAGPQEMIMLKGGIAETVSKKIAVHNHAVRLERCGADIGYDLIDLSTGEVIKSKFMTALECGNKNYALVIQNAANPKAAYKWRPTPGKRCNDS